VIVTMTAPIIAFDLDGTLVDTAPDLIATLNVLLARKGLPQVEEATLRTMIGGGARRLIERALSDRGISIPKDELDCLHREYLRHYEAHIADRSRPFSGLEAALDTLGARGWRFVVCTNKLEHLSVLLLERFGIKHRFAAICGQDTFRTQKPDPDMLRQTIARAGGHIERAVMVGDSATDIDMARAALVPVVAVDFGYSETPVSQLGPDRIISRYDDLPAAIFGLVAL
jgi:phosphoglycolate phosphatase